MITTATNVRRVDQHVMIPDGIYDGIWGGYRLTFEVDGVKYEANTRDGIRTPHAECTVRVEDGLITVEVK